MVSSAHLASLINVFKVFLDTDNTLVFSNAAVDFIACLLKHVRGAGMNFLLYEAVVISKLDNELSII